MSRMATNSVVTYVSPISRAAPWPTLMGRLMASTSGCWRRKSLEPSEDPLSTTRKRVAEGDIARVASSMTRRKLSEFQLTVITVTPGA